MIATRTPEGEPNRCPVCGAKVVIEPSRPPGDAPCPRCGVLLWFAASPPPPPRLLGPIGRRVGTEDTHESPFDAPAWRSGSLRARGAMAADLVRRGLLLGLGPGAVLTHLGEPDEQSEACWRYGLYRGIRITYRGSPHRLRLCFGGDRRVREVAIEVKTFPASPGGLLEVQ